MRKKVLLVEKSDAIRRAAEGLLRQNGYEVIALSEAEKALEVVSLSRPDLLVVGGDIVCQSGRPLYERVQGDAGLSSIPILLLAEQGNQGYPLPSEAVVSKPLEAKDFLEKVGVFSGQSVAAKASSPVNPLGEASLDDDFLDAALGLDGIDVVDSEVLDKTGHVRVRKESGDTGQSIGLDHHSDRETELNDSRRVESVMIHDDSTDIVQKAPVDKPPPDASSSGQIEILPDQYGISDPDALDPGGEHRAHDYDWFVNEMQRDAQAPAGESSPPSGTAKPAPTSGELKFTEPASIVDPLTPAPASVAGKGGDAAEGGVEKFIDEFKREVEKFHPEGPESVVIKDERSNAERQTTKMAWEDSVENVTPEQVSLFTRQLAYDLAERIAVKIVNRIDSDKLLNLLKSEILAKAKQDVKDGPR
jgi:twitching motility two-component system response regulator PilG